MHPTTWLLALLLFLPVADRANAAPSVPEHGSTAALPFVQDDYAKALDLARTTHRPIFVEIWAPWCHSCKSMRAFVLSDPSLARHRDGYVWLSIDGERSVNAEFRRRFPFQAYPTYLIVEPDSQRVTSRQVGGASVAQMHAWLGGSNQAPAGAAFAAAVAGAERAYGAGDNAAASAAYREVLRLAPKGWSGYARAVESQLFALQSVDGYAECVALAREAYPRLQGTASAFNVAGYGLSCALELPADDPARAGTVAEFESRSREVLADRTLDVAGDDRSGLLGTLVSSRQDAKDDAGSRRALEDWAHFLEGEAAAATTPERRAVYDSHRLGAYLELEQPERAVPMLQASERDFPDDYNPPARLAVALKTMKRYDDARAAADRALAKSYGPRKVRIYRTRADIAAAQSDSTGAQRTLEEALTYAQALPEGQRSESTIAELKRLLGRAP